MIYNTSEPHVVTAAKFCTNKFDKHKKKYDTVELKRHQKRIAKGKIDSKPKVALKRKFVAVTDEIEHKPSGNVVHRFNGINSYHSFLFTKNRYWCKYRPLTCHECMGCLRGTGEKCKNEYIVGKFQPYKFRQVIPGTEKIVAQPPKKKQKINEKAAPIEITVTMKNSIKEIREFVNENNLCVTGRSKKDIMKKINDLMVKRRRNSSLILSNNENVNVNNNVNNDATIVPMPDLQTIP